MDHFCIILRVRFKVEQFYFLEFPQMAAIGKISHYPRHASQACWVPYSVEAYERGRDEWIVSAIISGALCKVEQLLSNPIGTEAKM